MMTFVRAVGGLLLMSAALAAQRPVIVAFGNSLTAGYGAAPGKSYPDYLQRDLDRAGYSYRVVNKGESGDTTLDAMQRIGDVLAEHPAVVIVELGGNDGLRGVPVTATRDNLQTIVNRLQGTHPAILLAGMSLPPNYGSDYIHAFEQIYKDLSRDDHLPLLPFLYQDLIKSLPQNHGLLQADGIHATAAGNEIVAETVFHYLQPLLKK